MKSNLYIYSIWQTPDYFVTQNTQQQDTISSAAQEQSFDFNLQRQTIVSSESADTVEEVKPLPQTLQQIVYFKPKKDTLKFERFYFEHINEYKNSGNLYIYDILPEYKKNINVEIINRFLSERKYTIRKTKKTNNKTTKAKVKKEIEKKAESKHQEKIVVKIPKQKIIAIKEQKPNISKIKTGGEIKTGNWILGVLIFSLFVFGWIRTFYNKNFKNIIRSALNYQFAFKLAKESNSTASRVNFFLNLVFYLNISVFALLSIKYFSIPVKFPEWKLFLIIFVAFLILYNGKLIIFKILGFIFNDYKTILEYGTNLWIYNKLLGISLFPLIISIPFITSYKAKEILIYLGFILLIISFILRIFRSFQIAFKIKLSIFYMILYLCGLEILPIMIIGKMIISF